MLAHLIMNVEPVEINGQHFVEISMNGRKMKRRGPFTNAAAAKIEADRVIRYWQPNPPNVPATTVNNIVLHGKPVALDTDEGRRFTTDACRAGEGIITDEILREMYEISDADWADIAANTALGRAVRDERKRRIRNGMAAKEAACEYFTKSPKILDEIQSNVASNARHKIEAIRELRQTAIGGDNTDRPADTERFVITINLGADETIKIEVPPEDIRRNNAKQIEGEIDAGE